LPDHLEKLGEYAFAGSSLATVALPASLASVGEGAFFRCSALTSIALPAGVTSIGCGA